MFAFFPGIIDMLPFSRCYNFVTQINDLHFRKQRISAKTLTELHVRDVCVRTELCTRCLC